MIDKIEKSLIQKFFQVDPIFVISSQLKLIKKLPSHLTVRQRTIGQSNFFNILDFYKFEHKQREKIFWDIVDVAYQLPDKKLPLIISKINVGYFWLDYVTDINISYVVTKKKLYIHNNIFENVDIYSTVLQSICLMLFVSDFSLDHKGVDTRRAWSDLLLSVKKMQAIIKNSLIGSVP